jgi:hypothetical protein
VFWFVGLDLRWLHDVKLANLRVAREHLHRVGVVRHLELRTGTGGALSRLGDSWGPQQARRTGSLVKTPQPRKERASKPATPASNRASAAGPPSLYVSFCSGANAM